MLDHVYLYGWSAIYTRWVHHGEALDVEIVEYLEGGTVPDDLGDVLDVDEPNDDQGMTEMLADLYTTIQNSLCL